MKIDSINNVKYKIFKDLNYAVIYLPQKYCIASWGSTLDLVRNKILDSLEYIILDFSNVIEVDDCGLESLIFRKEFIENGGRDILHVNVPNVLRNTWNILDTKKELSVISEFKTMLDAANFINVEHKKSV